jgi:NAD(P)-dependent dehydrogenase (short-subunit alcohol dehydrogenase family)
MSGEDRAATRWALERMTDFSLAGKVAIVTGGAGDIGAAYARVLAGAGADVAVADLDLEGATTVATTLADAGLSVRAVEVDIASEQSAAAMATTVREAFGGIDILVNNAALMMGISRDPLVEFPMDEWDRVMRVNVAGALICAQACVPSMRERGGGKIVNQTSGGAFVNYRPYGVSKLALIGLTYGLARELGKDNINVNALAPGAVETTAALETLPLDSPWRNMMREAAAMEGSVPAEALCGALLFLCTSASDHVTGQCLNVDGGWVMRL